jgi:subtilisin-like proprotein convertase family protein
MNAWGNLAGRRRTVRPALCLLLTISLLGLSSFSPRMRSSVKAAPQDPQTAAAPETIHTTYSNPSAITPADRVTNTAGSNPGLPALYPSAVTVQGQTGSVAKVTVSFMLTSTFPDDVDMLLVGPTGAQSLILSDAGGDPDVVGVGYIFDQTAANSWPDTPVSAVPGGTYKPTNYAGNPTPEPGGTDNFPAPGPGLLNYPADLSVFNGTNPNGVWKLYVVDDQTQDTVAMNGGWVLDVTMSNTSGCATAKRPADMNGDGKTDYQVVRNIGGGQITWYTLDSAGAFTATQFGLLGDYFLPVDYDGDGKADVAVWRAGSPGHYYILQSSTNTLRIENLGVTGDNPTIVADYDGDGKADPAAYHPGTGSSQSIWSYRSSVNGLLQNIFWGNQGDFVAPGDYDGDGRADFAIQRPVGGGQAVFYRLYSVGGADGVAFGLSADAVVSGQWDGDCKTDIAVARAVGSNVVWYILNSTNGQVRGYAFGNSSGDYLAPGDYDGDGIFDITVWRQNPAVFYLLKSSNNTVLGQNWGATGDYPPTNYQQH